MLGEATIDRRATTGATCDSRHSTVGCRSSSVVPSIVAALILAFVTLAAHAENASVSNSQLFNSQPFNFSTHSYTNHAGNVVSGVVIALDARTVTISNATETAMRRCSDSGKIESG